MSFPRPQDSKPRRAEALVKGREYPLTYVAREKSKFQSKTGTDVFKVIAIYNDFGMKFHTYLPYEFDKMSEEDIASLNKKIKENENIRLVYYGKISRCLQVEILEHGQEVNNTKLEGIQLIEQTESATSPATPQKRSADDDESSPKKQCKCTMEETF